MKVILMMFLNNKRDGVPSSHLLSSNEDFSTETRLHLIELLTKKCHGNKPKPHCCEDSRLGGSPQTYSKVPQLKTTPSQLFELGEVKFMLTKNLHSYF